MLEDFTIFEESDLLCAYMDAYGVKKIPHVLLKNYPSLFANLPKTSWFLHPLVVDVINKWPLKPTFKNPNYENRDDLRKAMSQFEFLCWK